MAWAPSVRQLLLAVVFIVMAVVAPIHAWSRAAIAVAAVTEVAFGVAGIQMLRHRKQS